jgi:hypothetical protein
MTSSPSSCPWLPIGVDAAVPSRVRTCVVEGWEHLNISVDMNTWADSTGRHGELPALGQMPNSYTSAPLLDRLRAEGWTLTGIVRGTQPSSYQLLLERPKQ